MWDFEAIWPDRVKMAALPATLLEKVGSQFLSLRHTSLISLNIFRKRCYNPRIDARHGSVAPEVVGPKKARANLRGMPLQDPRAPAEWNGVILSAWQESPTLTGPAGHFLDLCLIE